MPEITTLFEPPELSDREIQVLDRVEELRKQLGFAVHKSRRWIGPLSRFVFAKAVQSSTGIEGYDSTFPDAVDIMAGEDPLDANAETEAVLTGYREAMTFVLQMAEATPFQYDAGLIAGLHYMIESHDILKNPGRFRNGPINVTKPDGTVVYEAPDHSLVPDLVGELVSRLNGPYRRLPVLVAAAMAHLNLVLIHPFKDGNGRTARVLQSLVLARQGIVGAEFTSIEESIGFHRQDYYDALTAVAAGSWNPERDTTPWIQFALTCHLWQAENLLSQLQVAGQVWSELEELIKAKRLHNRTIMALFDAAYGLRVRNSTYRAAAEISENLASRDLKRLVDSQLLIPSGGERRARFYLGSPEVRALQSEAFRGLPPFQHPFWDEEPEQGSIPASVAEGE